MENRRDKQILITEGKWQEAGVQAGKWWGRVEGEGGREHAVSWVEPTNRISLQFDSSKSEMSGRSRSGATYLCSLL